MLASLRRSCSRIASSCGQMNRLANERSPYLLQHAHNPVAWFPWGDEAFEAARNDNKLIFLSIGYSTCHWCHVMERESFENDEVAKILNEHYVSIKVDREERPDIDKIYMTYVQVSTGSGGWPLSVWLTPKLKPIFGGTYFPAEDSLYGLPGFKSILLMLKQKWQSSKNEKIIADSDRITTILSRAANLKEDLETAESFEPIQCIKECSLILQKHMTDSVKEPRFPQCVNGSFLMNLFHFQANETGVKVVEKQLQQMATGGIHDHLGGGFHRYAVDSAWQVPHFEKMLYDQAQILSLYCSYLRMSNVEDGIAKYFQSVATGVADYVLRDLCHPQGAFYSAEDADSFENFEAQHKKEGAFYVWTMAEILDVLSKKEARVFCEFFAVDDQGNIDPHHDPQGELLNQNTLFYRYPDSFHQNINDMAKVFDFEEGERLDVILESAKNKLLRKRLETRPRPHLDNKIVTAWNGLMIGALAKASVVLERADYAERALKAVNFIRANLFDEADQVLFRCAYTNGEGDSATVKQQLSKPIHGVLEDYVFLIYGLLELYDATLNEALLVFARQLQDIQDRNFWDKTNGGYYLFSESNSTHMIYMLKDDQDGAEPSANSVAIANLIRLSFIFDHDAYRANAKKTVRLFADRLSKVPIALPEMVSSLLYLVDAPTKIILSAENREDTAEFKSICHREAKGFSVVFEARHDSVLGITEDQYPAIGGGVTAYICKNFACQPPISDRKLLVDELRR